MGAAHQLAEPVPPFSLGQDEIDCRQRFLDLSQSDCQLLEGLHDYLLGQGERLADAFYRHLDGFDAVARLLADEPTIVRLKKAHVRYFSELTCGDYGAAYVANRLHIGQVHRQVGLEPQWYIGAYRKYLDELMPALWEFVEHDSARMRQTYAAVLKIVCFDMSLALDSYIQAERQHLLGLKHYSEQLVECLPCGLMVLEHGSRIRNMNRALAGILSIDWSERLRGTELCELMPGAALEQAARSVHAGRAASAELVVTLAGSGEPRYLQCTISPARLDSEALLLLVVEDITQRRRVEEQLRHMAGHDALTGLPNRSLLQDRLAQAILHARRAGKCVGVLFVDLDRFKNINDSLGHEAGDQVIIEVGRRLQCQTRCGDTVGRLGGDEFIVILADIAREGDVAAVALKMLDALQAPMELHGQELSPVASIGISLFPKDGGDSQALLMNADAAMYRAKGGGRGSFQFYAQEMNARTIDRLRIESGLRRALERDEFVLHYQPQIDSASGAMVGVEALLRWNLPGNGLVRPDQFIPIAEETGLIVPIGRWALHAACRQQRAWADAGHGAVKVAVNLSARQFRQPGLEAMVAEALHASGCPPSCLELEITESMMMDDPEAAVATLQRLSDMGVQLSIDDFGTGYSSLSYLKRFPIHSLKIDRSFVRDITTDASDAGIAAAIIALAHSMQLKVIAEGVEAIDQFNFLRALHCDQMQGFYFSPAIASDFIPRFMHATKNHESQPSRHE